MAEEAQPDHRQEDAREGADCPQGALEHERGCDHAGGERKTQSEAQQAAPLTGHERPEAKSGSITSTWPLYMPPVASSMPASIHHRRQPAEEGGQEECRDADIPLRPGKADQVGGKGEPYEEGGDDATDHPAAGHGGGRRAGNVGKILYANEVQDQAHGAEGGYRQQHAGSGQHRPVELPSILPGGGRAEVPGRPTIPQAHAMVRRKDG